MILLARGMVIDACLDPVIGSETGKTRPCVIVTNDTYNARVPVIQVVPITGWSALKCRITTNVELKPTRESGITKRSVADCLQTRPIDRRFRLVGVRGRLNPDDMERIDEALLKVFSLSS